MRVQLFNPAGELLVTLRVDPSEVAGYLALARDNDGPMFRWGVRVEAISSSYMPTFENGRRG